MPRAEQFGIGSRIDFLFLETLEKLRKASFTKPKNKLLLLEESSFLIDSLRFFLQISWESRLIPNNQYAALGQSVEEVGRMVGGWQKKYLRKLPR